MKGASIRSALVIHDRPDEIRELLAERCPRTELFFGRSEDDVLAALDGWRPDAVFSVQHVTFSGPFLRRVMEQRSIRWFHVGGSGYDYLLPWVRTDLTVTTGAGVLAPYLAETVLAGILALNANVLPYAEQMRRREWRRLPFRTLSGQTILIVGLGAIGSVVARLAKAFGMHVVAIRNDVTQIDVCVDEVHPPGALMDMARRADVISLHVRLTPETKGMVSRQVLQAMKPTALLINTSRGPIVDEAALMNALEQGQIGGAYLDVFGTEPLDPSSRWWSTPRLLITPHASDNVADWSRRYAERFVENLASWNAGRPLTSELRIDG